METSSDSHADLDAALTGIHTVGKAAAYRSIYLPGSPTADMTQCSGEALRPVLLLGGTSISLEDQKELLVYLREAGLDTASIETPMGGLLDIGIKPKMLRLLSLRDFIERLKTVKRIQGLDIIAHSYAAFEVVRTLIDAPLTYRPIVRSILLINPPGFKKHIGFVSHFSHTIWRHIVCGYLEMAFRRLSWRRTAGDARPGTKNFARREIRGIVAMSAKGMKNPTRTIREIKDIVSYKIARPIEALCVRYGYDFNLFLNADDRIVPAAETLQTARSFLLPQHIKVVPGGHNDILFQEWQRFELLSFLREIRTREHSVPPVH
jgi:hypothetical protein